MLAVKTLHLFINNGYIVQSSCKATFLFVGAAEYLVNNLYISF